MDEEIAIAPKVPLALATEEQQAAIDAILAGKSIFLTGPGGTGKSFLLQTLLEEFKKKTEGLPVEVVAMLVWDLYNAQWNKGYNSGYHDPDFEGGDA